VKHIERGGTFFRVVHPSWRDPLDTSYSKVHGGRWNGAGEFGVLYLCATILVAAANARKTYEGEIATLYDLLPEARPDLQYVDVKRSAFVDVATDSGIRAIHLPATFPQNVSWTRCQTIARWLYAEHERGIGYRSAATLPIAEEELAIFDSSLNLVKRGKRVRFAEWYPVEVQLL
jgi:RES domain-containing protein